MQVNFSGHQVNLEHPNHCPHCHNKIEPEILVYKKGTGLYNKHTVYAIWKCTYRDCNSMFSTIYLWQGGFNYDTIFLDGKPIGPYWSETIKELKSNFIKTYNQSLKAENDGLDEIAGMGFRKSIEYLVKDYLIQMNPKLKGKIESENLGKIIGENFNEPRESDLKGLLQRATWLGNDMTHYLKYHINFDISDLKKLIQLVMDEIHSIQQKRHYMENIESKHKKKK